MSIDEKKEENQFEIQSVSKVKVVLASPEKILNEWSYGSVEKAETVNYRTFKAEKGGLFCERIFGPTKDFECACGKYKSRTFEGVICDKCGVEVVSSRVRRERMGHIELAVPVAHIWFYRVNPCRIALALGITSTELKHIFFYEKYIVVNPGDTDLKPREILTEDQYYKVMEKYSDNTFKIDIGAAAIKEILSKMDLEAEINIVKDKIEDRRRKNKDPYTKDLKCLELLNDFYVSGNRPEWMILTILPVIPSELRPMIQLDGGRFATSDLNDIYRRVINRNNRLKKLKQRNAPEIILRNEKRMLQEAVDSLLDNSRSKKTLKVNSNRPLKSLSDLFKGKQGRFRQNLLGKRVDYSGRSVIVVGPKLKLYQCGVPKVMALELFRPFLVRELKNRGIAMHVKEAKRLIESQDTRVWGVLEEVIKDRPVLLNRAPTLHRLGIQAFSALLVEGKAIQLHPLVCKGYNADFDGDQMAIHVPLSIEAQIECWMLMLSSKNLLDPANGNPIVTPTQDMLLGLYILTKIRKGEMGENRYYSSFEEACKAYDAGFLGLHANIHVYYQRHGLIKNTSLGRLFFNEKMPSDYHYINDVVGEGKIKSIIADIIETYGNGDAVECLDGIKELGYEFATRYGISIGVDDIIIPKEKEEFIHEADLAVEKVEKSYREGILSKHERYNRVIEKWNEVNNKIKNIMFDLIQNDRDGFNPVFMMTDSGARGSKEQIRQLAGMRGLMAKPSGEIIDVPIKSNFKEGLTVLEYFNSTHGARKGLADTALKTADAGYLTRKLVDVAQNVVISQVDCETTVGLEIKAIRNPGDERVIESLAERIVGRYSARDLAHPRTGEMIIQKGEEISQEIADQIEKIGIQSVEIRDVFGCSSTNGLCVKCYGRNLATGKTVEIGEAVGIIGAQSIGQPGTQLTMRTFHVGGVASVGGGSATHIALNYPSIIVQLPESYVVREDGKKVVTRNGMITIKSVIKEFKQSELKDMKFKDGDFVYPEDVIGIDKKTNEAVFAQETGTIVDKNGNLYITGEENSLDIKVGTVLFVDEGHLAEKGEELCETDPNSALLIAEIDGIATYEDIIPGVTLRSTKEAGKKTQQFIQETKEQNLFPQLIIKSASGESKSYLLPADCMLLVKDGQEIKAGSVIGRISNSQIKVKDITGGLPKITELFEARVPKNHNFLAKEDGVIRFKEKSRGKYILILEYYNTKEEQVKKVKYSIPTSHYLYIRDGEKVVKGQKLCSGENNPHDILRILGMNDVCVHLLDKIQGVYREQGVRINDKHISVIIRSMLSKVEIMEAGDTGLIMNQKMDRFKLKELNDKTVEQGGAAALFRPILLGITKSALNTDSFIAAASFQETTRILTQAAIKGAEDDLVGLKENIIIGNLVPSGTGFLARQQHRDKKKIS